MRPGQILLLLTLSTGFGAKAQDTLWVKQKDQKPYLVHKIQNGETLFLLSKRYSVPPARLSDLNEVTYQEGLSTGSRFKIPVDNYNYIRVEQVVKSKPIFYKTGEDDDLRSISRMFNVSQSTIQRWNNLADNEIEPGQKLQVGWIAYDKTQVPFVNDPTATNATAAAPVQKNIATKVSPPVQKPVQKPLVVHENKDTFNNEAGTDTIPEISPYKELFEQQTLGVNITEEAGAAVFYSLKTKAAEGVYYAFHNTAIRGSILKIMNPASGKIIYAKVIGAIPKLKEYHNALLGLSSNAAPALGARDKRVFCKMKYR